MSQNASAGSTRESRTKLLSPGRKSTVVFSAPETSHLPFATKVSSYHIEQYDASALLNSIFGCAQFKGSAFDIYITKSVAFYIAISLGYALGLTYTNYFKKFAASEVLVFSALSSFLMAMYTVTIFHRWWHMRVDIQGICGNLSTFCWVYRAQLDPSNLSAMNDMRKARRWCLLAHNMLWLSVNEADATEFCDTLITKGQLLPEERTALSESDASNAVIVYQWMMQLVWDSPHLRDANTRVYLNKLIQASFAHSSSIVMHVKQQVPYAFAHLFTVVIRVHLFCFALFSAGWISDGIKYNTWEIAWGVIMTVFNTGIFTGLFNIHITLENPMNGDPNDFSYPHFDTLMRVNTALGGIDGSDEVVVTSDDLVEAESIQTLGTTVNTRNPSFQEELERAI